MVGASEIKRGMLLEIDGAPWQVVECSFQTPSARGASTITKLKLRNLKTGQVLAKSYRGGEQIPTAECEKRQIQFLYKDGDDYVFMDEQTYDQFALGSQVLGDSSGYLTEGLVVRSVVYNEQVIDVEFPVTVDLAIEETAPVVKGATAQAQLKPATLETGIQVMVPPYLTTGEKIKVDTRDRRFVERVKE